MVEVFTQWKDKGNTWEYKGETTSVVTTLVHEGLPLRTKHLMKAHSISYFTFAMIKYLDQFKEESFSWLTLQNARVNDGEEGMVAWWGRWEITCQLYLGIKGYKLSKSNRSKYFL